MSTAAGDILKSAKMGSPYNPHGLTTNCGFCSIARGIHQQTGKFVDADQLYVRTIERLGMRIEGSRDPISRQLIFPQRDLDDMRATHSYQALFDRGRGLSSYTISSVAAESGLRFTEHIKGLDLPRQFIRFYVQSGGGRVTFREFLEWRLDLLRESHLNPNPVALQRLVESELGGQSIIGSTQSNHFINMEIDPVGTITAYDAQDGNHYDGRGLQSRIQSVDLLLHLK